MKITKRIITFLFLAVLIFTFVSCSNDGDSQSRPQNDLPDNSDNPGNQNQPGSDENENPGDAVKDNLPAVKFNGEKFNMLTTTDLPTVHTIIYVEEETGDTINDAIYRANSAVESRFDLVFDCNILGSFNDTEGELKKSVLAGDNTYDYVVIHDRFALNLATEGRFFYTINELPHIDLDKPYWDKDMQKQLTIGNTLYFTYGANMLSVYGFTSVLVFNKDMVRDNGIENIYDLVRQGKWTFDKLFEMARKVTADTNGDGQMTIEDRWGIIAASNWFFPAMWYSEQIPLIAKDANDEPYFNVPGNQRLFDVFDSLYNYSKGGYIYNVVTDPIPNPTGSRVIDCLLPFSEGRGLFANSTIHTLQYLRATDVDYGVIPFPTLSEKRPGEPYSGRVPAGLPVVIPITSDPERASIVMEALACEYYNNILPKYYDVAISIKSTRDDDSIEMLKMVTENKFTDLGDSIWYSAVRSQYEDICASPSNTFQSVTERITTQVESTLDKAIDAFRKVK
ncbi:MAG: ABC transporter substrate-binding protein [Oscillospiraceae bacterium]|nr:ABC transporter substrate-binding protein [Oscillospiraceae bacterium]